MFTVSTTYSANFRFAGAGIQLSSLETSQPINGEYPTKRQPNKKAATILLSPVLPLTFYLAKYRVFYYKQTILKQCN